MNYPFDKDYLEFIGIKGLNTLPLAIRLSALYPDATATITMDQFLYLYSFDRIEYCDLLNPHLRKDWSADTEWLADRHKLEEIHPAYPETIRSLLLWCVEKGLP
jgi:hypothetical protein